MQQLTLIVICACLLRAEWSSARSLRKIEPGLRAISQLKSSLDCSQYYDDHDILASFPFVVPQNPLSTSTSKTYALINANGNVYHLNIVNERLVPSSVFCLKNLTNLYVRNTDFYQFDLDDDSVRRLPVEIERLAPSLTSFQVFNSKVAHLPDQIGKLKLLNRLTFDYTGLIDLPDAIGNLTSLVYLYLPNNKLTSLPSSIANLKSLKYLHVDYNPQLRSLQVLNDLPNLSWLDATGCLIERLPRNLPNLGYLDLSRNNLTDLVEIRTLGNGTNTGKSFYFNFNRIQNVPPEIEYVRNLRVLALSYNQLTHLPSDIFSASTLTRLDISRNLFTESELHAIRARFNTTHPKLELTY